MRSILYGYLFMILASVGGVFSTPAQLVQSDGQTNCFVGKQVDFAILAKQSLSAVPQRKLETKLLEQWPMECEGAATRLDFAVIETKKIQGAYLIIIARLGDGEFSCHLNGKRLAVIQEYVVRRGSDLKYVLAQGARVKGLGRTELYVGGQLKEILPYKKNATSHCEGEI